MKGSFTPEGKLVAGGMSRIFIWNRTPRDAEADPDVVLRPATYRNGDAVRRGSLVAVASTGSEFCVAITESARTVGDVIERINAAATAIFRFNIGMLWVLAGSCAAGVALRLIGLV